MHDSGNLRYKSDEDGKADEPEASFSDDPRVSRIIGRIREQRRKS